MLGGFPIPKVLLHCIQKFMKDNGLFDTLIETNQFGVKTAEDINTVRGVTNTKMECFWKKSDANIFQKNFH